MLTALPSGVRAQQPGKTYRVGLLATGGAFGAGDERRRTILEGLAGHGFVEGRNLCSMSDGVKGVTSGCPNTPPP